MRRWSAQAEPPMSHRRSEEFPALAAGACAVGPGARGACEPASKPWPSTTSGCSAVCKALASSSGSPPRHRSATDPNGVLRRCSCTGTNALKHGAGGDRSCIAEAAVTRDATGGLEPPRVAPQILIPARLPVPPPVALSWGRNLANRCARRQAQYGSSQPIANTPPQFTHCNSCGCPGSAWRWHSGGRPRSASPNPWHVDRVPGRATTDQFCGRRGTIWRADRSTPDRFAGSPSSTTSRA